MFYISINLNDSKINNKIIVEENNFEIKQRKIKQRKNINNFIEDFKLLINNKEITIYKNTEIFLNIPFINMISEDFFKKIIDKFIKSNNLQKIKANFIELNDNKINIIYKNNYTNQNYKIIVEKKNLTELKDKFNFISEIENNIIHLKYKIDKNEFKELMEYIKPNKNIYYYIFIWLYKRKIIYNKYKYVYNIQKFQ